MKSITSTVHVRVADAATGQATPVRIRIEDGDGRSYPPLGMFADFPTGPNEDVGGKVMLGGKPHAYIDGACEVPLPAGALRVHIAKGPEYVPQALDAQLAPGKLSLRFTIERWADLRADGWHSGDARAHCLSPHAAALEAAAEDIAVVNLLVREYPVPAAAGGTFPSCPNLLAFSGQQASVCSSPGHLVAVNTHNRHARSGSLSLLCCHRPVFPLTLGRADDPPGWTLADWCDQCHRKRGLVVWTPAEPRPSAVAGADALAELPLDKIDAVEITACAAAWPAVLSRWYAILQAGRRLPLVGASGKENNATLLGAMRTYARLQAGEELSYRGWIEAVRAGRTYVTTGPLLRFQVDGHDPGSVIEPASPRPVHVRADVRSLTAFDCLELVCNGTVVASAPAEGTPCTAALEMELATGGWLAVRCRDGPDVFAHSSPVYVDIPRPA